MRIRGSAFALCVACVVAPPVAQQQTPQDFRLRARSDLVSLEVSVTDARGNFVANLKRENFRVLDEGVAQPVTHFASIEAPAQVLVLVETGPAVYLIQRQHLLAAYALLDGLGAQDNIAVAGYDDVARLLLPFTSDRRAVQQALGELRFNLGKTGLNLFESLATALDWLAAQPGKKTIVLLTTGLDASGRDYSPMLEAKLQARDVVIYAVALGGELRDFRGTGKAQAGREAPPVSFEQADRALRWLAEQTGGQAFFPRRAEEFEGIYRRIAVALRNQYSLGFVPPTRDGRYHRLTVQILDDAGRPLDTRKKNAYRVRTRPGYQAPSSP